MGPRVRTGLVAALAFCAGISLSFFTLPLWVTFAINVAKEGSRGDWLGFFGSIAGAGMTLVAAVAAWLSVQKQIAIQRRISDQQTAIQQFTILQSALGLIQEEDRLNDQAMLTAKSSKIPEDVLKREPFNMASVTAAIDFMQKRVNEIQVLKDEFERAGKNRWAFPDEGKQRRRVGLQLTGMSVSSMEALMALTEVKHRVDSSRRLEPEDIARARAIDLSKSREALNAECELFRQFLKEEITRISQAINQIRVRAGI